MKSPVAPDTEDCRSNVSPRFNRLSRNSRLSLRLSPGALKQLTLLLLLLASALVLAGNVAAQTPTKRVLILTGYSPTRPAVSILNDSIAKTIREGSPGRVEFYYEFLENFRIPNEKYENEMVSLLRRKYDGENITLIVALGAPALKMLLTHETTLFSGVPKVYFFYDETEETVRSLWPRVTGVWADLKLDKTLDTALALNPRTQTVVVISGNSTQDKFIKDDAVAEFKKYQDRLLFTYLTDLTIDELQARLTSLPPNTIVLYLSFLLDKAGNSYSGPEALSHFAASTNAPIYGISETYLGGGIVGGGLLDFESLGKCTGEIGLRLMRGEQPKDIPPQTVPNVLVFDSRQLKRWHLDETKLPPGSVVRFKELTFWDHYKWYALAALAVLLFQAALISVLLFTRARRRQAERESKHQAQLASKEHQHLNEVVSNVPGVVWETRIDPATGVRQPTFVSDYVEKILGYRPEQWLSMPGFALKITHEDDVERIKREVEKVIASKTEGVIQSRWLAKDGRTVWVESHLAPILDENGTVTGLRGVSLDIMEQKLAQAARGESEERNRAILQAIPDLMFLQTRDGVYLDYHAQRREDLLVPPELFLGKNMRDVIPAPLAKNFLECFKRADNGDTQVIEYELPMNGAERWFEARIVRSGNNILSVIRDVTPRKATEEALRKNEAQLAGIISSAMDGIVTVNDRHEVVLFNAAAERIFQTSAEKAIGQPMDQFIPERYREAHREHMRLFGAASKTRSLRGVPGDLYGLRSSGEEFPMEASISQIEISGSKFFTVILRDITQRKRAEAELRESEANYRAVFNAASDAIFIQEIGSGGILDANNRMCEMYGWTVDEARSLTVADLSINEPPYTQEEAIKWIKKAAAGEPQLFEWRAKHKTGRLFWVEVNLKCALLRGKEVLLAVVRDITERKHAIDELRHSEERFAKAFRANPQPMSITTIADGLYLDVNESFLEMSGYTREEVIGHTSSHLKIWETPEARVNFIRQLRESGSVKNVEAKFRTKSGFLRVLLSSAEQLEIADEQCLLVASSDITERVVSQRALQESEARFRNMADTAPVMIWVAGEDKLCSYVNKQWLDFTGRSMQEEVGDGWTEGIAPEDQARCLEIYNDSFDKRQPFELEYRLCRKDGAYRWVYDSGAPRFSADGTFLGFIGSCLDITERKEAEVALQKAHEELHELKNQLEAENIYLQEELQLDQTFGEIVGQSDAIKYVLFKVTQVASTDSTVLITGETGTGKELVARAIHGASSRKDRPLIKVNCAALAASLIESELFGHEKGAFTGAAARKLGRFELANGGTIFLDEIGELPPELQVKLLRVIQEGEFERVGGTKTITADVRIIAATNRNLKLEVEKGTFREDLWYRLNVFPITVPPLRQRREDIPPLVEHFIQKSAKKFGKTITSVSPRAMQSLQAHTWPGNIRELANVIERAVIHTRGSVLHFVDRFEPTPEDPSSSPKSLEEIEREYISRTLESTGWRIEGPFGAAKILGLNPSTLRTRMLKLGIQRRRNTYA